MAPRACGLSTRVPCRRPPRGLPVEFPAVREVDGSRPAGSCHNHSIWDPLWLLRVPAGTHVILPIARLVGAGFSTNRELHLEAEVSAGRDDVIDVTLAPSRPSPVCERSRHPRS
jgi:hypothetical protein